MGCLGPKVDGFNNGLVILWFDLNNETLLYIPKTLDKLS